MLDYTKAAIEKTVSDLKRISLVFSTLTQALYMAYLIYAIVVKIGFLWLNITLGAVTFAYFVFYLVVNNRKEKAIKEARKAVNHTYRIIKISASAFNLSVLLYSIYAFPSDVKPISVVLASVMTVAWILQLVIELLAIFFESRAKLFVTALSADFEIVTKPINTAGNFIKKIKGEEIEPEEEPTKLRKMLDKKVSERRAEKEREKRDRKEKIIDFVFGNRRTRKENDVIVEEEQEKELAEK